MEVALNQNQATYKPNRQPESSARGRELADHLAKINEKAYSEPKAEPKERAGQR